MSGGLASRASARFLWLPEFEPRHGQIVSTPLMCKIQLMLTFNCDMKIINIKPLTLSHAPWKHACACVHARFFLKSWTSATDCIYTHRHEIKGAFLLNSHQSCFILCTRTDPRVWDQMHNHTCYCVSIQRALPFFRAHKRTSEYSGARFSPCSHRHFWLNSTYYLHSYWKHYFWSIITEFSIRVPRTQTNTFQTFCLSAWQMQSSLSKVWFVRDKRTLSSTRGNKWIDSYVLVLRMHLRQYYGGMCRESNKI